MLYVLGGKVNGGMEYCCEWDRMIFVSSNDFVCICCGEFVFSVVINEIRLFKG